MIFRRHNNLRNKCEFALLQPFEYGDKRCFLKLCAIFRFSSATHLIKYFTIFIARKPLHNTFYTCSYSQSSCCLIIQIMNCICFILYLFIYVLVHVLFLFDFLLLFIDLVWVCFFLCSLLVGSLFAISRISKRMNSMDFYNSCCI